ncbi:MAG TPA: response regulator, partial [Bacteroidia bacterium]|nr:response regulator [Bacteroidia bacterium]
SENNDIVNLRFSVSDSGIGIPQDKLPNIFDAFTQATYDTTRKYGGTGLGLAIVKQLIELQGGDIKVTSEVNKGSVFTFSLVYRKDLKSEPTKKVSLNESEDTIKELNVLLVEDNTLNQILAQKVLSDWGWKVEVADNGLIATEKVEKQNFDLVLMDIQLPEMDGYEATHFIREKLPAPKSAIPIIAMTAHAISGEEEKCLKAGMNGYISKPFNTHKLYQKIISVLNMKGNGIHKNNTNEEPNIMNNNNSHKHTDLTYLKKLANGSDEFITQMLTLFIEQTPDAVGRMEKHLQDHNWELLGKVAHKMKPSIMFVGLKELEKDVKAVEEYASGETHTEELPGMILHIKAVCNEAITELKEEMLHLH